MTYLITLLAASTLATWGSTTPVAAKASNSTNRFAYTGSTVQNGVRKLPLSGPVALAAVYNKFGRPMTVNQAAAVSGSSGAATSGTVAANPESYDAAYMSPVTIGGQTLNLDFDTGSSDLWVFSSELSAAAQAGHNIYNPSKSTTSKKVPGATWSVGYGDSSSASGDVYNDTVTVGGLSIPNQAVELASNVSQGFLSDTKRDGIFGLGFPVLNTITPNKRSDFLFTAVQQKALSQNVFTADLKKGKPGSYDFGFINSTKYTGSITYTNVDSSQGYWAFTSSGYGVGTNYTASQITGIADTGTSIIFLPDTVVNAYWAKVSGASYDSKYGAYTFPCSATLPTFTVGVGSARYALPGAYLNYGPVSSTSKSCFTSTLHH